MSSCQACFGMLNWQLRSLVRNLVIEFSIQASPAGSFKDNSRVVPVSKYSCQTHTLTVCNEAIEILYLKGKVSLSFAAVHFVFPSLFLFSVMSVSVWSWIRMTRSVFPTTNRSRSSASSWTLQKSWSQNRGAENISSPSLLEWPLRFFIV